MLATNLNISTRCANKFFYQCRCVNTKITIFMNVFSVKTLHFIKNSAQNIGSCFNVFNHMCFEIKRTQICFVVIYINFAIFICHLRTHIENLEYSTVKNYLTCT